MSQIQLEVLSMRYGQVMTEQGGQKVAGPHWCKLLTLDDEVQQRDGFEGNETTEFSVDTKIAESMAHKLKGLIPGNITFEFVHRKKAGVPQPVIIGVVHEPQKAS